MKTNYVVAIIVLIVLIAIGAGIYTVYKNRQSDTLDVSPLPIPSPQEGFASPSATPSSLGVNSQPVAGTSDNSADQIKIMEPSEGEYITNPFRVRGYLNKSGQEVQIAISDENGAKVAAKSVPCTATLDPDSCEFSTLFENINTNSQTGKIEAFADAFSDSVTINFN